MSREALQSLMTELADEITDAQLVGPAVAKTKKVRTRRASLSSAVGVLVLATATVIVVRPGGNDRVVTAPPSTPAPATRARLDIRPPLQQAPHQPVAYWPAELQPPAGAPTLTQAPFSHVVLLFSPLSQGPPTVYAYGEGVRLNKSDATNYHWARIDMTLVPTAYSSNPTDAGALDGRGGRAAFAQPDGVVVVDLQTAQVKTVPVPGQNDDVGWLVDGQHVLVSSATASHLVNVDTGTVVPTSVSAGSVAELVGGGGGMRSLTQNPDTAGGAPTLHSWDDAGQTEQSTTVVDDRDAAPFRIELLDGPAFRYGSLIAVPVWGMTADGRAPFVVALGDDGRVARVLYLGAERNKTCCQVVGMGGPDNALLHTDLEGLVEWDLTSGALTQLSRPGTTPGVVAIAPSGCDYTITIEQITASCIP